MILPDVNLLIYSIDETSPFHPAARSWWEGVLSSVEPVGLCYPSILGFVRLTTSREVFEAPLSLREALDYADGWLSQPNATLLLPTDRHWEILVELLGAPGISGRLTTDAHLAAHAIEHAGTLCSNDSDFGRFVGLRWTDPLAPR